ncbi:MAG: PQQ-binding-like beta-propeller repeat protein [Paracoccaceae bacterium]
MRQAAVVLAALVLVSACGRNREPILQGERLDVNAPLGEIAALEASDDAEDGTVTATDIAKGVGAPLQDVPSGVSAVPVSLPAAVANADWPVRGGSVTHRIGNAAAGAAPARVWVASIGRGDSRRNRIASEPVVAAGRVFAMDAEARLTAIGTNGAPQWSTDLTLPGEKPGEASGGGLAFDGGVLYATTGYGEVVALDAATGGVVWRQRLAAPAGGAPLVSGGTVYAAGRDGTGWAIRASDGKVLWRTEAAPGGAGVPGSSSPVLSANRVVFPFSSGQMISADAVTGATVWQSFVAGKRLGRAASAVADLTGDPVVADGTVFAGSSAGRLAAFNDETGLMLWEAKDGPLGPIALAGGAIWLVSDEAQLVRLDAATGAAVWRVDLPFFTKEKIKRRRDVFTHFGPVLAGGRLWTASSDGYLRAFDPASGAVVFAADLPGGGAAAAPVVAGGTIYVVTRNGQLHAFR